MSSYHEFIESMTGAKNDIKSAGSTKTTSMHVAAKVSWLTPPRASTDCVLSLCIRQTPVFVITHILLTGES